MILGNTMIIRQFFSLVAVLLLVGCATGSALVTGTKRAPTDPLQVTVYRSAPDSKFEHIGIVKSEAAEMFSQQEAVDRAVEELKKQAAKIGANGIILSGMGEKHENYSGYTPSATGGYFYSGTDEYLTLQGDAIYVKK